MFSFQDEFVPEDESAVDQDEQSTKKDDKKDSDSESDDPNTAYGCNFCEATFFELKDYVAHNKNCKVSALITICHDLHT